MNKHWQKKTGQQQWSNGQIPLSTEIFQCYTYRHIIGTASIHSARIIVCTSIRFFFHILYTICSSGRWWARYVLVCWVYLNIIWHWTLTNWLMLLRVCQHCWWWWGIFIAIMRCIKSWRINNICMLHNLCWNSWSYIYQKMYISIRN